MRKTHKTISSILTAVMSLAILTCTAAAYEGVSQETVKEVQQALNDAGFDCGTPDGIAGNKTSEAIIEYQKSQGLEENGWVTDELLASLGIVSDEAEGSTKDESVPSADGADGDFPAAEEMSYELYTGKWVKIGDQYEIWVPEAMDAAPIYDYIEISERHASLLYGRVDTEKPEIVLLIGTIEEYLGENPIEDTKVTTEDVNALLAEIQEDESYSGLTVNGIKGYYRESEVFGQGRITFISADPSCDIVIICVDQNLDENGVINNNGCWSENGHEYCMNMLQSFRKAAEEAGPEESATEAVAEAENP